ncbi:MAG TPA: hypothetical protein VLF18_20630 [Tahibacter sp.]|nr:hypothetical protein [Tahibacter sp.]
MRRPPTHRPLLRLVLLLLMTLGQGLLPGMAVACDDIVAAFGTEATAGEADASDRDVQNDPDGCCLTDCHDCCLHATATLVSATRLPALFVSTPAPRVRATAAVSGDYPVEVRPPIAV